jgi:hypothetical protein
MWRTAPDSVRRKFCSPAADAVRALRRFQRECRQGNEKEGEPHAHQDQGASDLPVRHVGRRDRAQDSHGRQPDQAREYQSARIDSANQIAGKRRGGNGEHTAPAVVNPAQVAV